MNWQIDEKVLIEDIRRREQADWLRGLFYAHKLDPDKAVMLGPISRPDMEIVEYRLQYSVDGMHYTRSFGLTTRELETDKFNPTPLVKLHIEKAVAGLSASIP